MTKRLVDSQIRIYSCHTSKNALCKEKPFEKKKKKKKKRTNLQIDRVYIRERNWNVIEGIYFYRDIAARNCLIEPSSLRVRLADTALARDLFPQDYHCLGDNENRPIRWMALETLQHNQYSTATDVVRITKHVATI